MNKFSDFHWTQMVNYSRRALPGAGPIMETLDRPRKRVTLRDIAENAGVSTNAASKVLNSTKSSARVSEDSRQRILAAAKEMGYRPNGLARSLQRQRTDVIGLYIEGELNTYIPFISALINGVEWACQRYGQSLLLLSRPCEQSVAGVYQRIESGLLDGVIMPAWSEEALLDLVQGSGLPAVVFAAARTGFPCLQIDEQSAVQSVLTHLAQRGHHRLLYRARPDKGSHRQDTYESVARAMGMDLSVVTAADTAGGLTAAERVLFAKPAAERPSAVVCWNDEYAYEFLKFCTAIRLKVPQDVAVVGFDGDRTYPDPPQRITTVNANWDALGRLAVESVLELRAGRKIPPVRKIPVELWVRDTT